jgi:hypothetical protein
MAPGLLLFAFCSYSFTSPIPDADEKGRFMNTANSNTLEKNWN